MMENGHHHTPETYHRSFAVGVALNVAFVGLEAGYGIYADSLALIADAGHNLSDVASLLLAWGASLLAKRDSSERRTYGYKKATVLSSFVSSILLLVALGGITWEAARRLLQPQPVEGTTVMVVAGIGVVVNALTALLFIRGQKHDLNVRGAFLHMVADAGVSLGVVAAGVMIALIGWHWIDPAVSLAVVAVIFWGTWGLLRESANYAMDAVPRGIETSGIRQYLLGVDRILHIHDLHVWPLSTTDVALTVHVVVKGERLDNRLLNELQQHLHDRFGIAHATIQVEAMTTGENCLLDKG